jgi:hypothetical protein
VGRRVNILYVNSKMITVETTPGIRGGG